MNKFPRKLRLITEAEFKGVLKNRTRQKITSRAFDICFCGNGIAYPRLAVVVPKRNIKEATKRNYFKRVVRENFRLNQHRFKHMDIVVFVNSAAKDLIKRDLHQFLEKQFGRLML